MSTATTMQDDNRLFVERAAREVRDAFERAAAIEDAVERASPMLEVSKIAWRRHEEACNRIRETYAAGGDIDLFVEALAVFAIVQACGLLAAYCVDPDAVLQQQDVRPCLSIANSYALGIELIADVLPH